MKKEVVMPVLVLTLICLIAAAALSVVNSFTAPVILAAKMEQTAAVRTEIIPQAAGFELIEERDLPESVVEAYRTTNQAGYIFILTVTGYGGEMKMACGISEEGKIIACKTLEHAETQGIGSNIVEEGEFIRLFPGRGRDLEGISAVSGATASSEAYIGGVRDAFTAFDLVKGDVS